MNRFTGWQDLGSLTFTPDDTDRVVGSFSIGDDDDTIWIRVESETPPTPWPWSYGILGWKTEQGYELGSVKAYSDEAGQVFRLGVGLQPVERSGVITFEPRGYNLAWIKRGNPWTLNFSAQSGSSSSGVTPIFGTRASLGVLSNLTDLAVSYAISKGIAFVSLIPK